jgi:uracil-DNA glycosylase
VADVKRALAEHLRYFQELGVEGLAHDPAWSRRPKPEPPPVALAAASTQAAAGASSERAPEVSVTLPVSLFEATAAAPVAGLDPAEGLAAIRSDLGECTRCKLHTLGRAQIVFGVGSPTARLMFVGEAPGQDEDRQGIPFVGRAGQLLTRTIERLGLRRDDVYIANVIKCRPPGNRDPEPDEVATCQPFLFRQIDVIRPKVIVALGAFATHALLQTKDPISKLRGRVFTWRGARLIPTFHPAFLLRNPPEAQRREAWNDFKKARALLDEE